jgi:hypothetical protein
MTIKKKNKVLWTVICLVGILAVGIVAYAYTSNTPTAVTTVIENAGGVTINNPVQPAEENLGSVVSADTLPSMVCTADNCTYTATGDFINASTTIVSVADPFLMATTTAGDVVLLQDDFGDGYTGATSTVDLVRLMTTGVSTTTYSVHCASAPTAYATSSNWINIITSTTIATSTGLGVIENNIATTAGAEVTGGSVAKIMIGPSNPYIICKVYNPYYLVAADMGGFTGDSNTFAGKFAVRFSRIR